MRMIKVYMGVERKIVSAEVLKSFEKGFLVKLPNGDIIRRKMKHVVVEEASNVK